MIDREKVLAVLRKRFPQATPGDYAAAANAIVGLDEEWEDVTAHEPTFGSHTPAQCRATCFLAAQVARGAQLRVFLRRDGDHPA